jgi:hypothetical protein
VLVREGTEAGIAVLAQQLQEVVGGDNVDYGPGHQ